MGNASLTGSAAEAGRIGRTEFKLNFMANSPLSAGGGHGRADRQGVLRKKVVGFEYAVAVESEVKPLL